MNRSLIVLLAALFTQGAWAETHSIKAFLADPVTVLDEQGKQQRELAKKDAPTQPLPVLQYNQALDLVQVELAGQKVWLDTMDLRIEPPLNVVDLPCQGLTKSQAKDSRNNSTIGFGAGCNQ
ncbi:MAG: hypothetical protein A2W79_27235 [Pseudomonadales bacterium RIFCSPLOWO2_12_60_38]|jgi:hypothetical protein|uniref:Uncharacterized protein n=6 Tax=Pseudomonas TaxID=286 RepID=A0A109LD64_PSEFL|nr:MULTISPECIES: hypothetical protein [Pseudomonas]AFJ58788.1 hypothetical protein PflA506_0295 [Pseudomonas fluorescens A506]ETK43258.1 hypothetical protein H098_02840 [Pseudomonas fluorescens FH5]MDN5420659.1 hypothetical protein [Pseudomonadales bacterium]OHC34030.1 MAG: hypothetical protein A2W79_27235 [Pseudomonadales bacterium RIFCSPLOWO2_12_60_38]OHC36744.1 MAG: hypothetical protein A3G72_20465 [Pseudomonadales bacterium RIFCSPLOWO2_12_FULL_59_450]PMZ69556.1 hypothetical protein C1X25_|tara:strand:+ start:188 stop:553 length:366 start_codon:yes stop_codon:yes gene_type:complete